MTTFNLTEDAKMDNIDWATVLRWAVVVWFALLWIPDKRKDK